MYYIGIDLGGTNIAAGIVDENGKILKKGSVPTNARREPDEIIYDMAQLCKRLVSEMDLKISDIEYAGIATPGTADSDKGVVVYSNNIPFKNFPIADKLKEFLGIEKAYVGNDADAAAKGEASCGASKGYDKSIMITLGTGLGGGIIIDKKIYSGFNYAGGELGHTVIVYDGVPCTCGRNGCWESYSSATGLVRMTKEKMLETKDTSMWEACDGDIENVGGRTAFDCMKKGDKAASDVVDMYIRYLACGIVNMINIFQPEVLVIGGGICNEGDYLLLPLLSIIDSEQYSKSNIARTQIKIAQLGNDAGIIGAAMLGL